MVIFILLQQLLVLILVPTFIIKILEQIHVLAALLHAKRVRQQVFAQVVILEPFCKVHLVLVHVLHPKHLEIVS